MHFMQPKISVIIPCWHATEYLDKFYESIQAQTFKDAEWIFVNDGDASQNEKLQAMAEKDSSIRVIWKENGGVSYARNMGIDEAKGEWIVFSDADDWFRPYYLERLYSAVKDSDADMAVGGISEYKMFTNSRTQSFLNIEEDSIMAMGIRDAIKKLTYGFILLSPCNKIYKASIIKENNLKFDHAVKIGEDAIFNMEYYCLCKRMSLVKDCGYIYMILDTTSALSKYDPNRARDSLRYRNGYKKVLETHNLSQEDNDKLMTIMSFSVMNSILLNSFRRKHPPFRQAVREIREYVLENEELMRYAEEYRKNNRLGKGEKYLSFAVRTRSAVAVYLMLKPVFWIRYKSPKFYVRLKSLIYGKK